MGRCHHGRSLSEGARVNQERRFDVLVLSDVTCQYESNGSILVGTNSKTTVDRVGEEIDTAGLLSLDEQGPKSGS
jgi:hypothetical protein